MNREPAAEPARAVARRLEDWKGTARYEVRSCIGAGGMGAVYEVFDRERGQTVAIKRLRFYGPAALYLFKREFRTLSDVHHPNLVRLHELVATEDHDVFFTMELVRGVDFVVHARDRGTPDYARLRAALRQLVLGVQALHAAGKLHRDIKPSNVLVTPEGRVVLLDFGVATELSAAVDGTAPEDEPVVGTAAYMAPEQASNATLTPASDWYGVGAVLFEAIVGRPPFVGSAADVLRTKIAVESHAPSDCVKDVPPDLDSLCKALLRRDPGERPGGREILGSLGTALEPTDAASIPAASSDGVELVGRAEPLSALRGAFEAARAGRVITVLLGGPSGSGKSALAQTFVDELGTRSEALVLRGRAYERESVPYKAMDSWVDALSRHLLWLSDMRTPVELPLDVWALARLFPVLRRVPEIADVRHSAGDDLQSIRRRAFGALRDLLVSLARAQPIVVFVDDAHWGDADSAALLHDLLLPPREWPCLLLMTYRTDQAAASPFLSRMRAEWPPGADLRELPVGPLDTADAEQLALSLLGDDATAQDWARMVARESGGSPFLVEELVRTRHSTAPPSSTAGVATLEQAVAARVSRLPDASRRILEMLAVGGRPLPLTVLAEAAGLDAGVDDAVETLRAERLARVGLRHGREVAEITNDRVREAILVGLPADGVRQRHARLARVMQATPGADPEAVAVHLLGADRSAEARPYAEQAAEQAMTQLAFDRAVRLFRMALEGTSIGATHAHRLRVRLAAGLSLAGRGAEAARAYLDAAQGAPGLERVELERAAAEQLLTSGRIDEGAEALRRVLGAVGMRAPRSTFTALLWLLVYRIALAVVGLRFTPRRPDQIRHEDRVKIDALYAAALGFATVDVVLGACMQARLLLESLRAGDTPHILRAVSLEVGQRGSMGGRAGRRERALVELAERLSAQSGNAELQTVVDTAIGLGLFLRGRWSEARRRLEAGSAKVQRGHDYWRSNGLLFGVRCLFYLGDLRELRRRQMAACADAEARGDLYLTVNFAISTGLSLNLLDDDPDGARRHVHEAMAKWSQTGFFVQQWQAMALEPDVDLYVGDGAAAYDRMRRMLPALRRSLLLQVQFIRAITAYALGRSAIASIAAHPARRGERVAEARRMARRLRREGMEWTAPLAALVEACAANAAGDRDAAIAALRVAVETAEVASMQMHATAARHRLGVLLGGQEGRAHLEAALRALSAHEVRCPARWTAIYLPGQWGTSPAVE